MKKQMKNNIPYKFVNSAEGDEHVMVIDGAIGESGWFYDATSAKDVRNALDGITASTVRIKLNSGGGDVFDGIEIYNYLKDLKAKVVVEVTALAASAASLIAMGADEIIMKTGATMMIHEASTWAYGNKSDIQKVLNGLEAVDESIISIYTEKTGLDSKKIRNLMESETWFTAEEAVELGFATATATVEEPQKEPVPVPQNNFANQTFNVNIDADDLANKVIEKLKSKSETAKPIENKTGLSRFAF